jgi:pimeloyl-ACP methyl ester carboxylesterase
LLHGLPSSSSMFRHIMPGLARRAYVIAPDLPGFGQSDVLPAPSFEAYAAAITELLEHLGVKQRFIYLHDYGAPVGLRIAMKNPGLVSGLIIQNANAHRSGFGPTWSDTFAFWADPNPETEAKATTHLSFEGTRGQYSWGVPEDVANRIEGEPWIADWEVMNLPGRMRTQKALLLDYGNYAQSFDQIAAYLAKKQPPALMVWGRHDVFFDLAETVSWMQALPRMEAHILDAGHFLLETHAEPALALMTNFIKAIALNETPAG